MSNVQNILTGDNEWFTPSKYIESARKVMGSIDIDPASNHFAQLTVKADKYCTIETNGLDKHWIGNVWLNPPYGRGLIAKFVNKALDEPMINNMIILVNSYPDTSWYHLLLGNSCALCMTRGRIHFEKKDGAKASPPSGQTFFYIGNDPDEFTREFSQYGFCINLKG